MKYFKKNEILGLFHVSIRNKIWRSYNPAEEAAPNENRAAAADTELVTPHRKRRRCWCWRLLLWLWNILKRIWLWLRRVFARVFASAEDTQPDERADENENVNDEASGPDIPQGLVYLHFKHIS